MLAFGLVEDRRELSGITDVVISDVSGIIPGIKLVDGVSADNGAVGISTSGLDAGI